MGPCTCLGLLGHPGSYQWSRFASESFPYLVLIPLCRQNLSLSRFASESFSYLVLIPLCRQNLSLRRESG